MRYFKKIFDAVQERVERGCCDRWALGESGGDEICNVISLFISSRGFFEDLICFSMIFWL